MIPASPCARGPVVRGLFALLALGLLHAAPSIAQENAAASNPRSMIKLYAESRAGPPARIADMAWIEGHWIGDMPNGPVEQVVLGPRFGHMPGFVRALAPGNVIFYEISVFMEVDNSLTVRVKHFTPELAGWEAREAYIDRPLVDRDATNFFFDGITVSRTGPDSFTVYFLNRSGSEEGETIVIPFRRKSEATAP